MLYRPAAPADAEPLALLGRASFCAAFGDLYRPEDLAAFLDESHSPATVAAEIADPDCLIRLAEDDGGLAGYCKLRRRSKLARYSAARRPIELGQLYTAPGRTGQGIGAALMDWTLAEAAAGGHDAILLSVYSENPRAQRFYARYGFAKIADITFRVGEQIDAEYLFARPV